MNIIISSSEPWFTVKDNITTTFKLTDQFNIAKKHVITK